MGLKYEPPERFGVQGLGPVDPSLRALSGRLQFTVRRHKLNQDSLSGCGYQSIWSHQLGQTGLLFDPKLNYVYHTPIMSTWG